MQNVQRFRANLAVVEWTLEVLESAGADGYEAFVLWGGVVSESAFEIESVLVPEQVASRTEHGLLVTVSGDALFSANKYFFDRGHLLAAQIHSHPTEAFHSATDDAYPLATLEGALSVVVPYFGMGGVDDRDTWAYLRLVGTEWIEDKNGPDVLEIL